ncbi:D-ribose transporter ATP-binding protein [Gordoniibacillus kamchatkensis]|uniref:D-ribose transporter ATP-binding protein n=1 Tax=Gordoniibacillus kamchatkensis TaxID=1590651 RepID=A0ABR5AI56_9BACL|nr:sugar ABC transporter ATP-binding protein [Paenibacillus sp. VKM B-2647]KIL40523.1 D-ribose transporter ATP-binding protein [Paenibacillus sp. VKM B-2647]
MSEILLAMKDVCKSFPGVKVLENVQFELRKGELHALMGENGAGKSTLMKIVGGIYRMDRGSIAVEGSTVQIASPSAAQRLGIAIIHQELNLIPHLSIMENIFLGREFKVGRTPWINWRKMKDEARSYLRQLGLELDPGMQVSELSVGQQQLIEIAKALSMDAKVLVLDEPTAALTDREIDALFEVITTLKAKGVGMVYISHRMEEIFRMCDRVTVLRDGQYIGTERISDTSMDRLVKMMVGREIKDRFPKVQVQPGQEKMKVSGLSLKGKLHDISFAVRSGEILGIAGLMGAGRTELAKAICGVAPADKGTVSLDGRPVAIKSPVDAIRAGIALITEDRKGEGLLLSLSVRENLALPNLNALSRFGFMKYKKENQLTENSIRQLLIKTSNGEQKAGSLSGGNQQKVVIGKWLAAKPQVLILDEPTRGVDIGAKKEIYDLMNELVSQGVAIIMISSELPEVLGMSDRILVMHEGRITGEFARAEASQENIMLCATGRETLC